MRAICLALNKKLHYSVDKQLVVVSHAHRILQAYVWKTQDNSSTHDAVMYSNVDETSNC